MGESIITVENLSKRYRIGTRERGYKTFREVLVEGITAPIRNLRRLNRMTRFNANNRGNNAHLDMATEAENDIIWALKDVTFEVKRGEVWGVIGRNGAGKSTLLKILSRITEPTTGDVKLYGRISSLLEVGTGFSNELTGRENIFLNGTILGMTKKEIRKKFAEIIAFSEIDKFLDTPVKYYSSGMYVRLAFAVAAHLEPEILVVDEVLAVGDVAFQKKCLGKMGDVAKEGRTVLFVSHNMQAINTLCDHGMLLDQGRVKKVGKTTEVIADYLQAVTANTSDLTEQTWPDRRSAPGNDRIRVHMIRLIPDSNSAGRLIDVSTSFRVEIDYWNLSPGTTIIVNLFFYTIEGTPVFESISFNDSDWHVRSRRAGLFRSICYIPGHLFNEGSFRMKIRFMNPSAILYDHDEAALFTIHDVAQREIEWYGKYIGSVRPMLAWKTMDLNNVE
jgi:lipopolysaccharide transport system ATP-binding protein